MRKRRRWPFVKPFVLLILLALLLAPSWPDFGDERYQLSTIVQQQGFDFLVWESQALWAKAQAIFAGGQTFLDEATRKQVVLDYLAMIQESNRLKWEIEQLYVNPEVTDPDAQSVPLQTALTAVQLEVTRLQPLAEAIVQEQVGVILREQGLTWANETWPPVLMHMSPLPSVLIVSPRDRIERKYQVALAAGLPVPDQERIETAVFDTLNLAAFVTPIGGMATYPAMIQETGNTNWLADVVAHEWTHHWLMPYPVSLNYVTDPAVRTINETTASIVGGEIGRQVIARFYPELLPPVVDGSATAVSPTPDPTLPPPFDFRAEMAATRVRVDELLADGNVVGAEAYMEARRRVFVANGYNIRKLNQAYFAFYGAYADEPGATGSDPIGPTLLALRAQSPTLKEFLQTVAWIGRLEDLQRIAEEANIPWPDAPPSGVGVE